MKSASFTPPASFTAAPRTRRRALATGAALATLASGVLAACGQQGAGEARPISPTVQGALRWSNWATGASLERSQQKQKVFAELYPNVTVEALSIPTNYAEKIVAESVGGTAADVIMVDGYQALEWAGSGLATPLDDRMAKTRDSRKGDFQDALLGDLSLNGKTYGLPTDVGPVVMAFNPELFARANVPLPRDLWRRDAWTMDAFVDAGKKLVAHDPPATRTRSAGKWGSCPSPRARRAR